MPYRPLICIKAGGLSARTTALGRRRPADDGTVKDIRSHALISWPSASVKIRMRDLLDCSELFSELTRTTGEFDPFVTTCTSRNKFPENPGSSRWIVSNSVSLKASEKVKISMASLDKRLGWTSMLGGDVTMPTGCTFVAKDVTMPSEPDMVAIYSECPGRTPSSGSLMIPGGMRMVMFSPCEMDAKSGKTKRSRERVVHFVSHDTPGILSRTEHEALPRD